MDVKPITPDEVRKLKQDLMSSVVFMVVNMLIMEKLQGDCAVVWKSKVVERLVGAGFDEADVPRWVGVEEAYGNMGWEVEYKEPGYMERYPPMFIFKIPH